MIVLLAFAVLAGAATAITPCVLPVLPALLSASGTGGRRRPLGVVTGLALTHTITIVGIASVVDGVGFADGTLRTLSIFVLLGFGLTLLIPAREPLDRGPDGGACRASGRAARATASGRGCRSAGRSASSTRRARDRSSPR